METRTRERSENILTLYLREIGKIPLLSRDEEQEYARCAVLGDRAAKEKLLRANLRFVIRVAKKYQNRGLPLEDLISEGNIGLIKAIERFDPDKGYHFISYAVWWIRQAMQSAIREKSRMIRIPRHIMKKLEQLEDVRKHLEKEKGGEPGLDAMAEKLGITEQQLADLLNMRRGIVSLEDPAFKDSQAELTEQIADTETRAPEETTIDNSLMAMIKKALKRLPEREAKIIELRYGLNGNRRHSLQEIADIYNITKERVRQIEIKAVRKLRHSRSYYFRDYFT